MTESKNKEKNENDQHEKTLKSHLGTKNKDMSYSHPTNTHSS